MQRSNPQAQQKPSAHVQFHVASRAISAILAGWTECGVIHPIDSIRIKLQANKAPIPLSKAGFYQFQNIIFPGAANASIVNKTKILCQGIGTAMAYKGIQRLATFGFQPIFKDEINATFGNRIEAYVGKQHRSVFIEGAAGAASGLLEVGLIPIEAVKTKRQKNQKELISSTESTIAHIKKHGLKKLSRGAGVMAVRNLHQNIPLFTVSAVVKEYGFQLKEGQRATIPQEMVASAAGAVAAVTASNPYDVIKTRVQLGEGNACTVFSNMSPKDYTKGLEARLAAAVPRLIIAMTIAKQLPGVIDPGVRQIVQLSIFSKQTSVKQSETAATAKSVSSFKGLDVFSENNSKKKKDETTPELLPLDQFGLDPFTP